MSSITNPSAAKYDKPDDKTTPFVEDVTDEIDGGYDGDAEGQLPELEEPDTDDDSASEREPRSGEQDETALVQDFRKLSHETISRTDGEGKCARARRNLGSSLKRSHSRMLSDSDTDVVVEPMYSNAATIKRPRRRFKSVQTGLSTPVLDSENAMDIDIDILSSPHVEPP